MIEDTIIEDLSERTGYSLRIDDLPPNIRTELRGLTRTYKRMMAVKNEISIKQKELNRPGLPFMKKKTSLKVELSSKREELRRLEEEYERTAKRLSDNIMSTFRKRFEAKEGIQRNININASEFIEAIKKADMTTCPNCGAPLKVDSENGIFVCEYCGSKYRMMDKVLKEIL